MRNSSLEQAPRVAYSGLGVEPKMWILAGLVACGGSSDGGKAGGATAPSTTSPVGTAWTTTGSTTFPVDTADLRTDQVPGRTLRVSHRGYWDLAPAGGPWTTATGRLVIQEGVNGVVAPPADTASDTGDTAAPPGDPLFMPDCWARFDLSAVQAEVRSCPGCTLALEVTHRLVAGSLDDCVQPDLPEPDDVRTYGWDAAGGVWLDYADADVWVRVWDGELDGDRLRWAWTELFAIEGQDTGDTGVMP
ncbi:MAG: hypothetical protein ACI8PZ_004085 [Myxococcota bacterium]|jgi:hypothetical protein